MNIILSQWDIDSIHAEISQEKGKSGYSVLIAETGKTLFRNVYPDIRSARRAMTYRVKRMVNDVDLYRDIESGEIVTVRKLFDEYRDKVSCNPTEFNYPFAEYIENCLVYHNGTLEKI